MMESVSEVTNFGSSDAQRMVVVQKDEKGYGLTVSGDKPVRIQSIKDGGAASKAGVQEGDTIIKVNGSLVTNSNHAEVVKLIKAAGSYVALTLLGKAQGPGAGSVQQAPFTPQLMEESKKGQITAPTPASNSLPEKKNKSDELTQYYDDERMETLSRYLESEKQTFIQIQDEYNNSPSEKLKKELLSTRNRIKVLETQIAKESQRMRAMPTIQEPYSDTMNENVPSYQTDRRGSDRPIQSTHYRQRSSPDTEIYSQIPPQEAVIRGNSQVKRNRSDVQDRDRGKKGPRRDNAVRYNNSRRATNTEMTRAQTLPGDPEHEEEEEARLRASTVGVMDDISGGGKSPMGMNLFNPAPTNPTGDMFAPAENQRRGVDIIAMEDEFQSDQEMFDEHGPFDSLEELEKKPAHLAVFLHYLISNNDPSSLFFYLVIESFKAGSPKDMKKWSYEIFSTFIADNSPMKVESITKDTAISIENDMSSASLPDDKLKHIFDRAQGQAVTEVIDLLAEFRRNRSLGLGSIFGDQQLTQENMERSQEIKIAEQILMPHLDRLMDIKTKREDKNVALAAALSTFMRQIGVKVSGNSSLERCPSFATKEKKGRTRPSKKHIKGHQFQEKHYTSTAFCGVCGGLLWGIGNQGLCCQDCELNLHRNDVCLERLVDQCPGKPGRKTRASGIRGMIPAKVQNLKPSNRGKGDESDRQMVTSPTGTSHTIVERMEEENEDLETIRGQGRVHNLISQFKSAEGGSSASLQESSVFTNSGDESSISSFGERGQKVQRSSSLKNDREPRNHRGRGGERRSKSDFPEQDRSKDDVDMDQNIVAAAISRGDPGSQSSLSGKSQESISSISEIRTYTDDSDMEAEQDTPNWQGKVDKDIVKKLKPKEVKRQEIINELFHTERTHVRNLKVLDKVFYQPMLSEQVMPKETVMFLFPNLPELIEEHSILNNRMKKDKRTSQVIQDVGNLLLERFDGEAGERMKAVSAEFCINQRHCLETIKSKQRKETKLNVFISEAEADPLCRRLPLRGIISTQMQRLTKYPLFIQQLLKYTQPKTDENAKLEKALQCCKDLLDHVNQAVREADNRHRLVEIRSKTDLSPYERTTKGNPDEVNTSQIFHKLLYDSPITWKLSRNKTLDMHAMLLEDYVVLLQKQDDKFVLKFHSTSNIAPIDRDQNPTNNKRNTHSPIIRLSTTLFREVATSKKAFFLISTSQQGPQIYELQAPSSNEKKVWMDLIKSAQDNVKRRNSGRGVNPMNLPQRPEYHHNLDSKQESNSANPSAERAQRANVVMKKPEVVTRTVPFNTPPVVEEQGDAATLLRKALEEPIGSDADSRKTTKYILLLLSRVMRLGKEQNLDQLIVDGLERCHKETQRMQNMHMQELRSVEDDLHEERLSSTHQAKEVQRLEQQLKILYEDQRAGGIPPEIHTNGSKSIVTDLDRSDTTRSQNRHSYSADSNSSNTDDSEGPEHDYEQVTEIVAVDSYNSGDSSENTLQPLVEHVQAQVPTEVENVQLYNLQGTERVVSATPEGQVSCIQEESPLNLAASQMESMQLSERGSEEPESPYMTLADAHSGEVGQYQAWEGDRRTSIEAFEKVEDLAPMTSPIQAQTLVASGGFSSTSESLSSYADEASGSDVVEFSGTGGKPEGGATLEDEGSLDEGARLRDSKPDESTSTTTSSSGNSRPGSIVSADSGSEEAKLDSTTVADGKGSEENDVQTTRAKPTESLPELVEEGTDPPAPSSTSSDGDLKKSLLPSSDSLDDPGTDVDNPMLGERLQIVESMSDLSVVGDQDESPAGREPVAVVAGANVDLPKTESKDSNVDKKDVDPVAENGMDKSDPSVKQSEDESPVGQELAVAEDGAGMNLPGEMSMSKDNNNGASIDPKKNAKAEENEKDTSELIISDLHDKNADETAQNESPAGKEPVAATEGASMDLPKETSIRKDVNIDPQDDPEVVEVDHQEKEMTQMEGDQSTKKDGDGFDGRSDPTDQEIDVLKLEEEVNDTTQMEEKQPGSSESCTERSLEGKSDKDESSEGKEEETVLQESEGSDRKLEEVDSVDKERNGGPELGEVEVAQDSSGAQGNKDLIDFGEGKRDEISEEARKTDNVTGDVESKASGRDHMHCAEQEEQSKENLEDGSCETRQLADDEDKVTQDTESKKRDESHLDCDTQEPQLEEDCSGDASNVDGLVPAKDEDNGTGDTESSQSGEDLAKSKNEESKEGFADDAPEKVGTAETTEENGPADIDGQPASKTDEDLINFTEVEEETGDGENRREDTIVEGEKAENGVRPEEQEQRNEDYQTEPMDNAQPKEDTDLNISMSVSDSDGERSIQSEIDQVLKVVEGDEGEGVPPRTGDPVVLTEGETKAIPTEPQEPFAAFGSDSENGHEEMV